MPATTTEIARYSVHIISESDPNRFAATARLYDAAAKSIAFLRFYRDGDQPAPNEFRTDLGSAQVSYRLDALTPLVDVLRNEKPLYFTWFDYSLTGGNRFATIGTSRESVGESEPA